MAQIASALFRGRVIMDADRDEDSGEHCASLEDQLAALQFLDEKHREVLCAWQAVLRRYADGETDPRYARDALGDDDYWESDNQPIAPAPCRESWLGRTLKAITALFTRSKD